MLNVQTICLAEEVDQYRLGGPPRLQPVFQNIKAVDIQIYTPPTSVTYTLPCNLLSLSLPLTETKTNLASFKYYLRIQPNQSPAELSQAKQKKAQQQENRTNSREKNAILCHTTKTSSLQKARNREEETNRQRDKNNYRQGDNRSGARRGKKDNQRGKQQAETTGDTNICNMACLPAAACINQTRAATRQKIKIMEPPDPKIFLLVMESRLTHR